MPDPKRCEVCGKEKCLDMNNYDEAKCHADHALVPPDGHSSPPPRPDEMEKTAVESVLKYLYEHDILEQGGECSSWCGNGCGCSKVEEGIREAITQALLSSRDQGYQEGVEDAVKAVEDGLICEPPEQYGDRCENCDGILEPEACLCAGRKSALSSLKDKLKPKEKGV